MNRDQKNASYKEGYDAGVKIACAIRGITPGDAIRRSSFADSALSTAAMQTAICKVAAYVLKEAGMSGSPEHVLYSSLSKSTGPLTQYSTERFITPVVKALAKEAKVVHEENMEKSAAQLLSTGAMMKLFGRSIGSGPEALRLLALLGVGGGASAGALTWALNRDATQDDADIEAKQKQAEHYRQIASDLQKRLNLEHDNSPQTQAIKKTVADQGEGAYVI